MLKIKDEINLDVLDYYGFKKQSSGIYMKVCSKPKRKDSYPYIWINESRYIHVSCEYTHFELDTIFDMIKDNMVEKIS